MNLSRFIKSERHRQLIERWWVAIVIAWDIFKTFAVDKTFAKYGVNPYLYFAIVMAIAYPYARTTARMFFSIVANNWRSALISGSIALVLHFIPDVFILITAKQVPHRIRDGFFVVVALFTFLAIREVILKVRSHKKN